MTPNIILEITGAVAHPLHLTIADLDGLPDFARVVDVSRLHPARRGDGVLLQALLDQAVVEPQANYLTLHADRDDFHVSVPLEPVKEQGIIVYRIGPDLLPVEHGGPIRFLVPNPSACHTGELDECANVKYLSRIELSQKPGRDTRPITEAEHEALHKVLLK